MSHDIAIDVQGLGKRFEIGPDQGPYRLMTETIVDRVKSFGRRPKPHEFWALRDVDFQVRRGETFGVIGHNGAGKSTLLKILARITPPTEGRANLRGRVGALLEVGTGFHPELTGRENVFLNGAILSMSRREIERKFWEIVEFADIGPFIDTPVKRYSTGMQLRLAFSVAAHLEPEILIVDEVLAVGDIAFQEKCLGRMEEASREGRTVLFISHNLASVRALCDRAMMLSNGRITQLGSVPDVLDTYIGAVKNDQERSLRERTNRAGDGRIRYTDIGFARNGRQADTLTAGEDCEIVLGYETAEGQPLRSPHFAIEIATRGDQIPLLNLHTETVGAFFPEIPAAGEIRCRIPRCPLPAGQYIVNLWCEVDQEPADIVHRASELTVAGGDFFGSGREPPAQHRTVMVDHSWSLSPVEPGKAPQLVTGTPSGATDSR